jgi:hypothetical protein
MRSQKALIPNLRLFTVVLLLSPFLVGHAAVGASLEERRNKPGSTRGHAVQRCCKKEKACMAKAGWKSRVDMA